MKKTLFKRMILALTITMVFTSSAFAAGTTLKVGPDNFTKKETYQTGAFTDVKVGWEEDAVKLSYELGLMNGKGPGTFDPDGKVTLGETVSMAARVHEIYNGGDGVIENADGKWYAGAVKYALSKRIIKEGVYSNFDRAATRSELAQIFYNSIPSDQFKAINKITSLPDVNTGTAGTSSIFALYNAGVLTGSDAYGTFYPASDIKRSEAAAILTRVVVPAEREAITLKTDESTSDVPDDMVSFVSRDSLYTLVAPKGWVEKNPYSSESSSLEIAASNNSLSFIGVTVKKEGSVAGTKLEDFTKNYLSGLQKNLINPTATSPQAVSINGVKGLSSDIAGKVGNNEQLYRVTIVENDDCFIQLVFLSSKSDESDTADNAKAILKSFQFK